MKTLSITLSLLVTGAASLSAQTAAPAAKAPVHHTTTATTTAHHAVPAGPAACATDVPPLSPKIPALPTGSPCPKALYTITRKPDISVDYISPLVGEDTRKTLTFVPVTFSLDYVDTKIGTGALAKVNDYLSVHYTGYTTDGSKFDSSLDHPGAEPLVLPYGQHHVIQGWDTGFEGMHVGGKRRLFIPYQLAYGEAGHPPAIPAKSWLIFDIELVAQSSTPPEPKAPPAPPAQPTQPQPSGNPAPAPGTAQPKPATPPPVQSTTPDSSKPKQ